LRAGVSSQSIDTMSRGKCVPDVRANASIAPELLDGVGGYQAEVEPEPIAHLTHAISILGWLANDEDGANAMTQE
jgi:hypothetical protein